MTRAYRNADSIAREHTQDAFDTITNVMNDPFAENRDRLNAAKEILDRGFGKPAQAIIAVPGNKRTARILAAMSDDELVAAINSKPLPRLNAPDPAEPATLEAEYHTVPALDSDPLLS
jgi:hypothetical protein